MNTILILAMALLSGPERSPASEAMKRPDPSSMVPFPVVGVRPEERWYRLMPPAAWSELWETENERVSISARLGGMPHGPRLGMHYEHYLGRGFLFRGGVEWRGGLALPVEIRWIVREGNEAVFGIDLRQWRFEWMAHIGVL